MMIWTLGNFISFYSFPSWCSVFKIDTQVSNALHPTVSTPADLLVDFHLILFDICCHCTAALCLLSRYRFGICKSCHRARERTRFGAVVIWDLILATRGQHFIACVYWSVIRNHVTDSLSDHEKWTPDFYEAAEEEENHLCAVLIMYGVKETFTASYTSVGQSQIKGVQLRVMHMQHIVKQQLSSSTAASHGFVEMWNDRRRKEKERAAGCRKGDVEKAGCQMFVPALQHALANTTWANKIGADPSHLQHSPLIQITRWRWAIKLSGDLSKPAVISWSSTQPVWFSAPFSWRTWKEKRERERGGSSRGR